jgi:hypothetical protein
MTITIELHPGTEIPPHSNLVIGLFKAEGDAQACWFEDDDWRCTDFGNGMADTPEFWFEVPSVGALKGNAADEPIGADEGASDFS